MQFQCSTTEVDTGDGQPYAPQTIIYTMPM